jgi:hypothetical protein
MNYIILVLVLSLSLVVASPADAATFCRNYHHRNICIIRIKRSAKNYWEYRAAVSIDGVQTAIELYDCRDRTKIRPDKTIVPFEQNGPGELICSIVKQ